MLLVLTGTDVKFGVLGPEMLSGSRWVSKREVEETQFLKSHIGSKAEQVALDLRQFEVTTLRGKKMDLSIFPHLQSLQRSPVVV